MNARLRTVLSASTLALAIACGSTGPTGETTDAPIGNPASATSSGDGGSGNLAISGKGGDGSAQEACDPPDMLLVLDRTLTMHRTVDGATPPPSAPQLSKFWQALDAIEGLVAPPLDSTLRFGLELWPHDPGKNGSGQEQCVTLMQRINDVWPTNPECQGGDIAIHPALGSSAQIQSLLDPMTTHLCQTTPTGAALETARGELASIRQPGRAQHMILITDGADWDGSCPEPDPRKILSTAAAQGIQTFVVGFASKTDTSVNGGVGKGFLNDMACAGKTAKNFATTCKQTPDGYRAVAPQGDVLFYYASSAQELSTSLRTAASTVCCNCIH